MFRARRKTNRLESKTSKSAKHRKGKNLTVFLCQPTMGLKSFLFSCTVGAFFFFGGGGGQILLKRERVPRAHTRPQRVRSFWSAPGSQLWVGTT